MVDLEAIFLEPFFPFHGFGVGFDRQILLLHAAVFDVDMTVVLLLLGLTSELFERLGDRLGGFGVVDVLCLPLLALKVNDFRGGS